MLAFILRKAIVTVAVVYAATLVAGIYLVDSYLKDLGLWNQLSIVVSAATALDLMLVLLITTIWRRLWRTFPSLNDRLYPDLNGTWDVIITSEWQRGGHVVHATAEITQIFTQITINLQSDRSVSETLCVVPAKDSVSNWPRLYYVYQNEPTASVRQDDQSRLGAAVLRADLAETGVLRGNYFTDRATKGDHVMTRRLPPT